MASHDKVNCIDIEPAFLEPSRGRAHWENYHHVYVGTVYGASLENQIKVLAVQQGVQCSHITSTGSA